MNTHNICFHGEIRNIKSFWLKKKNASEAMIFVIYPVHLHHNCIYTHKLAKAWKNLLYTTCKQQRLVPYQTALMCSLFQSFTMLTHIVYYA